MYTEEYMKENVNKVDWNNISHYQILSEKFIRAFQNKVNWRMIYNHQKISKKL